jgi:hypothetical protein
MLDRAGEDKQEVATGFSETESRLQIISSDEIGLGKESG